MPKNLHEQISLLVPREVQALDVSEKVAGRALQETQNVPEDVYAMMHAYKRSLPTVAENYQKSMDTLVNFFDINHEDARNLIAGASVAYVLLARQAIASKVDVELEAKALIDASQQHKKSALKAAETTDTDQARTGFTPENMYCNETFRKIMSERPVFAKNVTQRMAEELGTQNQHACTDYMLGAIITFDAFARQAYNDGMISAETDFLGDDTHIFDFPLLWHTDAESVFPIDCGNFQN
jgi:hypothetical protein